jgi:hypothetical protein
VIMLSAAAEVVAGPAEVDPGASAPCRARKCCENRTYQTDFGSLSPYVDLRHGLRPHWRAVGARFLLLSEDGRRRGWVGNLSIAQSTPIERVICAIGRCTPGSPDRVIVMIVGHTRRIAPRMTHDHGNRLSGGGCAGHRGTVG